MQDLMQTYLSKMLKEGKKKKKTAFYNAIFKMKFFFPTYQSNKFLVQFIVLQ